MAGLLNPEDMTFLPWTQLCFEGDSDVAVRLGIFLWPCKNVFFDNMVWDLCNKLQIFIDH